MTFCIYLKELAQELVFHSPPQAKWERRSFISLIGSITCAILAIILGIYVSLYFLLCFIGMPILVLYSSYCDRQEDKENKTQEVVYEA